MLRKVAFAVGIWANIGIWKGLFEKQLCCACTPRRIKLDKVPVKPSGKKISIPLLALVLVFVQGCASNYERLTKAIKQDDIKELRRLEEKGILKQEASFERNSFSYLYYKDAISAGSPGKALEFLTDPKLFRDLNECALLDFLIENYTSYANDNNDDIEKQRKSNAAVLRLLQTPDQSFCSETRLLICLSEDESIHLSSHAAKVPTTSSLTIGQKAVWGVSKRRKFVENIQREGTVVRICESLGKNYYGVTSQSKGYDRKDYLIIAEEAIRDLEKEQAAARLIALKEAEAAALQDSARARDAEAKRIASEAAEKSKTSNLQLLASAEKCDIVKVTELLKAGADVNFSISSGRTPLYEASSEGGLEVAKLLIEAGAIVDAKNSNSETALFIASSHGHTEIVKLLLARGATTNVTNRWGWTPLMYAARDGNIEVTRLLVANGANVNSVNTMGWSILNLTKDKGHTQIVTLLENAGATNTPMPAQPKSPPTSTAVATKKSTQTTGPQLTERQKEILAEIEKSFSNILRINAEMGNEPQGGQAPKYDAKVYTGQSCNEKTGVCTNNYQGGTESVSSYYSRTGGNKRTRELEYELVQHQARYDFWLKELRKTEK